MRRRGRRVAVGLLVALTLTSACSGKRPPPDGPSSTVGYRLVPSCPAPVAPDQPATAKLVNKVVAATDLPGWQAADIGASVKLADGRLVWVFGDTVRSSALQPRIVANSMLVSSNRCVSQLRASDDGPIIPDVSSTQVRWPMSVALLDHAGQVPSGTEVLVVLCARTQRGTGGNMDFQFRGTSAAIFTVEGGGVPTLVDVYEVTPDNGAEDQINWGAAAMVHGPWFYVYGSRLTGQTGVFGHALYAARAPQSNPRDRSKWQFWDGGRWQSDRGRSAPVISAEEGVSQTLSVSYTRGKFVVVSKRGGDLGDFVYTWVSSKPTGPFSPHQALKAPAGFDTGEYQYAPLAHPEIPTAPGHLLVSVSRNTSDLTRLLNDPEVGRPVFAEVTLP